MKKAPESEREEMYQLSKRDRDKERKRFVSRNYGTADLVSLQLPSLSKGTLV